MSVQILSLVIYSHDGRRRDLQLKAGHVNIITGSSKSGKSSLIEIVNYCFGSGQCDVPEGPIRHKVAWFGLRLQLASGQAFVARRCPFRSAQSSEECFVSIAESIDLPDYAELHQTTNTMGVVSLLGQWCGLKDNLHEPPAGQTRPPLSANARHALLLCFQPQDEIIRRQQLFHGTTDRFVADSLRDTLPYLLGAVDEDYIRKRGELRRLREQLRAVERQLGELKNLQGEGVSKAANLLAQARDLGLSSVVTGSWEESVAALVAVSRMPLLDVDPTEADTKSGAELNRLADERRLLVEEQRRLREEIAAVQAIEREEHGYAVEAAEQQARLTSIGIFVGGLPGHSCPVCSQELPADKSPVDIESIKKDLAEVSNQLTSVTRLAPQIIQATADLQAKLQAIRNQLASNNAQTETVRGADALLQTARDAQTRRAHVLGKIALYVESMPELPDVKGLENRAQDLRSQCAALEEELSDDNVQERLNSISSLIGSRMTEWARTLQLEHSAALLRLDVKKLTIIADTEEGPVPMQRIGSGENWVGYHLIAHLALHEWFAKKKRPVPRFLFLDQPSQVYFPAEKDPNGTLALGKEEDRLAVIRMFKLVIEVVGALLPELQVIITEHADILEDWYHAVVVERWRDGIKLVPDDWPVSPS